LIVEDSTEDSETVAGGWNSGILTTSSIINNGESSFFTKFKDTSSRSTTGATPQQSRRTVDKQNHTLSSTEDLGFLTITKSKNLVGEFLG